MTAMSTVGPSADRASVRRPEFEIRPGVLFPNWDAVRSEAAAGALLAMFEVVDVGRRWTGHGQAEDRVYRAVLAHYAAHACAPSVPQLSAKTGMDLAELHASLKDLDARDLIVLDRGSHVITGAYPFTDRETEHRVIVDGQTVHAMCAVDALGAPAMIGRDAVIESSCRGCNGAIRIETRDKGTALKLSDSLDTVVWLGLEFSDGCSATSLCSVTAFFCSDEHLQSWRQARDGDYPGYRLAMAEAHQVGLAIFSPRLTISAPNA